ncbi:MAG TPA: LytTR family DNA-binding domain-containing protein [Bacteroidales bacterium]
MFNFKSKSTEQMLQTIIIDDELHIQQSLESMLKKYCPSVNVVAKANSVKSGLAAIQNHHPDLVLLDIRMDDGTGFDLLKKLDHIDFKIIFVTAYDQYAVKAFKYSALNYLLKPVDPEDLSDAIRKAETVIMQDMISQLGVLEEQLHSENRQFRKIILKTQESIHIVYLNEICYFESDGNYTTVFQTNGLKIILTKPIREFDDILKNQGFFRVHKSFLVNLSAISRFDKGDGGFLVMNSGDRVPVASRKKDELLEIFNRLV